MSLCVERRPDGGATEKKRIFLKLDLGGRNHILPLEV